MTFMANLIKSDILSTMIMSTYVWLVKLLDSETIPIRLSPDIALVGVLKMEISNFVVT